MAKKNSIYLPSGQGALLGGFDSSLKTKFEIKPELVIYFSLFLVFLIWLLYNIK